MDTGGWGGSYKEFILRSTHQVSLENYGTGAPLKSILKARDVASRTRYSSCITFAIVVHQQLDEKRFLTAATAVLKTYPSLGSRLQLQPPPTALDLSSPAFPVSFATWPRGSAARFKDDYNWQGKSDDGHLLIPSAPFFPGLKVQEIVKGLSHLFALQVTSLGDGATLIAATWLHALADALRMGVVLNALASAYRGISNDIPEARFFHMHGQSIDSRHPAPRPKKDAKEARAAPLTQDGLLEGPARVNDPMNYRGLYGVWIARPEEAPPGWNGLGTVTISKVGVQRFKDTLRSHPLLLDSKFSSNDVLLALIWMLQCDTKGYERPGEGAAGSIRHAAVAMDLSTLVPGHARPGYLGNYVSAVPVSVETNGQSLRLDQSHLATSTALAQTIRAIREAIIDARSPAGLADALTLPFEGRMSSTGFLASVASAQAVDAIFTNWNHIRLEAMDFGSGPPKSLNGHFGVQQCNLIGVVALDDDLYGIRLPLHSREAMQRLKDSHTLFQIQDFTRLLGI